MKLHKSHVILPLLFLIVQIQARRDKPTREIAERRRDRDRDIRDNPRDRYRESERTRDDQIAIDSISQYESVVASPPPRYHSTKTPVDRPLFSEEEPLPEPPRYPLARPNSLEPGYSSSSNAPPSSRNNIRDHVEDLSNHNHNQQHQHMNSGSQQYTSGQHQHLPSPHVTSAQHMGSHADSSHQDATEEVMQDMRPPEPPKLLLPRINLRHDGPKFGDQSCQKCGGFTLGAAGTCCKACGKLGYNKGCWCRSCDCLCYDT